MYNYLYSGDEKSKSLLRSDVVIAVDILRNNTLEEERKLHYDAIMNSLEKLSNKYVLVTLHDCDISVIEKFENIFRTRFEIRLKEEINNIYVFMGKIKE